MRQLALGQMVEKSDKAFVGLVLSTKSRWSEDGGRIVTDAYIEVIENVRGTTGGEVVVVTWLGGTVGNLGMLVHGDAKASVGDKAVFFTQERGGTRFVTGMAQGLYQVDTDERGTERIRRDLSAITFLPEGRIGQTSHALTEAGSSKTPRTLREFLSQVRQEWETCEKKGRCRSAK